MTNEVKTAEACKQILGNYDFKRAQEKAEFYKPYNVELKNISTSALLEELSKRDNVFIPYVATVDQRSKSQIAALKEAFDGGNLMTKDGAEVLVRAIEDAISKFCHNL